MKRFRLSCCLLVLLAANIAHADPAGALQQSFSKLIAVTSFRATLTELGKQPKALATMEFVAPNRYRIATSDGPIMLIIGSDGWMDMGGQLMKLPIPIDKITAQYRNEAAVRELARNAVITSVDKDSVDGEATTVYTYTMTEPVKQEARTWVSDSSGLPIQVESTSAMLGRKSTTRLRYTDFNNDAIRIEKP